MINRDYVLVSVGQQQQHSSGGVSSPFPSGRRPFFALPTREQILTVLDKVGLVVVCAVAILAVALFVATDTAPHIGLVIR